MKNKIIILSGGMDSITLLHQEKINIKKAVSFDYGQKHFKEVGFAKLHCNNLNIPHDLIDITSVGEHLKSNLLKSGEKIPEGHYEDKSMKKTVVPFRNGIMLSIACGIAESNDCEKVLIANHAGDHAIYPDCRATFIDCMSSAMGYGTYIHVNIEAPYTGLTKRQIALIGQKIGINYKLTWSCYKGGDKHCGVCGTCVERKEALDGFDDTIYAK